MGGKVGGGDYSTDKINKDAPPAEARCLHVSWKDVLMPRYSPVNI